MERVRQYQVNRLKYYYAVAEFDSVESANRYLPIPSSRGSRLPYNYLGLNCSFEPDIRVVTGEKLLSLYSNFDGKSGQILTLDPMNETTLRFWPPQKKLPRVGPRSKNTGVQPDPITENAICNQFAICNNNIFSMISVIFCYQCVRGVWRHGVRAVRHAVRPPVHPWGHGVHQSVGIRLPFPARPHLLRTQGINDFRLLIRQSIRLCGLYSF